MNPKIGSKRLLLYPTALSTTPNHIRFRLLNAGTSIKTSLALHYDSLQQVDVYGNGIYVSPITYSSPGDSNYFNRTTRRATFLIDDATVIDLKISQLIVLAFGLPSTTPSAFFTTNLVANLVALLGVSPDIIRRVNIISANNDT
ncbi:unnamed protein product [Rotaria socialis]|uniref:Uncharacterized protein n=1 Tax=Rotaria socialis TaxID=392032 RepID=A0A820I543_9BILA|nr:unnamed protein product [Rotaria socialis]CAF3420870.1 unnamed protein product [Rotaria socialis]CAF4303208.1 unnamed protein product [Rotaria socialis]